jgi:phosphoenolpyruvate synthase/pyruvate phosphate dikinase
MASRAQPKDVEYIASVSHIRLPPTIGNKARNLQFLIEKGFPVPVTYVCNWDAYLRYLQDDAGLIERLRVGLAKKIQPNRAYAVRSSANVEDDLATSFAGQFKTVLNVQGIDAVLQAILTIWALTRSPSVQTYLAKMGVNPAGLRMAVVIQEMVQPVISGVSFSKNPMTGMDETVVEAVCGSGEALVQEGCTPQRWVNKWGEWVAFPEPERIDRSVIQQVVTQTRAISKAYGRAVDLEWVYDGRRVYWVQLREITTVRNINLYSHRIPREILPGMIKPLIWSINIPLVGGVWKSILTDLIGPNDLDPHQLIKPFYYRAYFNMGTLGRVFESLGLPRESIEMMMGVGTRGSEKPRFRPSRKTLQHLPRIARFIADKFGFETSFRAFVPDMQARYRAFRFDQAGQLSERELVAEIDKLFALTQDTTYYNILGPMLMFMYNGMLRSRLKKAGVDAAQVDMTHGLEELHELDPNFYLAQLRQDYRALDAELQDQIRCSTFAEFRQLPGIEGLQKKVEQFIQRFGHLSDSGNDFASVPWRENPDMVLKMIAHAEPVEARTRPVPFQELDLPAMRKLMLNPIYSRARRFRLYREQISSLYTYGYGLFRPYFMALGDHFVRRGILETREGILYLYFDEIREVVEKGCEGRDYAGRVATRKQEMEAWRDTAVPETIYGDQAPPLDTHRGDKLVGIPTSRGHYTGQAKVVRGIQDFDKVSSGNVLVVPYSDVGWTPLFVKAGAVIAESGGMLSHSSIVAREYNIPAVVSVPGACSLKDDTVVTVDGYRGEVIIHEQGVE